MTTDIHTSSKSQTPWGGLAVAAAGVVAMVVASVLFWPDMAQTLVTREAAGNHGQSEVSRGFTAVAMPLTLVVLAALFAVGPRLDQKYLGRLRLNAGRNLRNASRVLSYVLAGLTVVLLVIHLGLLSMFAGRDYPIEEAVAAGVGFLLVLLGIALPLARPEGDFQTPWLNRYRDALGSSYRRAAYLLIALGLVVMVFAFIAPVVSMVVAALAVLVVFGGTGLLAAIRASRPGQ
ncbi:MAG: hypothetical protein ABWX96_09210 [Propionibacteriaceae bacterium]